MSTTRLEAFSDAVIAILITIMVLELDIPDHSQLGELRELVPVFLAYALSFVNLGIYWNNHHHLLAASERINGKVLWANLHLLFWLSLFPFTTGWMGENNFDPVPTAGYGVVALAAAIAFFILKTAIVAEQGHDSKLAEALGSDLKGKISPLLYLAGIPLAFVSKWISLALYIVVALMWLVPDPRIERRIYRNDHPKTSQGEAGAEKIALTGNAEHLR